MKAKEQIPVYWYNATDSQVSQSKATCPYCQHEDDEIWELDLSQETPAEIQAVLEIDRREYERAALKIKRTIGKVKDGGVE